MPWHKLVVLFGIAVFYLYWFCDWYWPIYKRKAMDAYCYRLDHQRNPEGYTWFALWHLLLVFLAAAAIVYLIWVTIHYFFFT